MREKVYIIAEAGVNHNGDVVLARRLVEEAFKAGADAVKFQTFTAEGIVSRDAPKAEYQQKLTRAGEGQFEMLKRLELGAAAHRDLLCYSNQLGIDFLSSPFDMKSIDFLVELGLETLKIPSGEITNLPYLRKIGSLNKRLILSTGMAYLDEVRAAYDILMQAGSKPEALSLLHCNTEYPTPFSDVNLRAMLTLQENFPESEIGYSDHTLGNEVSIAAVALGAKIIERHFTLDRTMEGPDHAASLDPEQFHDFVQAIRHTEEALGSAIKQPSRSEQKNINKVRKSIVAARPIKKGEVFSSENLATKRPAEGISPMEWDTVIGRQAPQDFAEDDFVVRGESSKNDII